MNAPPSPRKSRGSPALKRSLANAVPFAALILGRLLCKAGAPLVNLGFELREWAIARLID